MTYIHIIISQNMRVRSAVRRLCKDCRVVKRRKRLYVTCKRNPRHKQRQGFSTATQSSFCELVPTTTMPINPTATRTTTFINKQQQLIQPFGAFSYLSAFR